MAQHRHKRETNTRRPKAIQIAGPVAVMATVSAVSLGVFTASPPVDDFLAASSSGATALSSTVARSEPVSRSESRAAARAEARRLARQEAKREAKQEKRATLQAVDGADTKVWTTTELNLWTDSDNSAEQVGVLDDIKKVLITGRKADGRVEVVIDNRARWVTAGYFSKEKPETGPTLGGSCTNGSSVSPGVHTGIVLVHEAVCANYPEISTYGTFRGDGEHSQGRAVDIMISGATGQAVADFLRANYAALDIEYIIYAQHIWSVERSGEGWRAMSDRGSTTANHYDHVHVTVY